MSSMANQRGNTLTVSDAILENISASGEIGAQMKTICTRCVYDDNNIPNISFDEQGVCNYCHQIEDMRNKYKTGTLEGEQMMLKIVERIKQAGRNKKYDCIIGVSGGTDSSYLAYLAVEKYGLRPLAVHLDNTFNNFIATENIRKVLGGLKIDLVTHVVESEEAEDIYRSFFKASVVDFDVFADIGVPQLLYKTAAKYGVKFMLEGHSYIAEGISPLGTMYADGKYLQSVQKKFGTRPLKTFPNMYLLDFIKWITLYRIEKIRPLWYEAYSKEDARELLSKKFGWEYYDGHHLENRTGAFHHSVLGPQKFSLDSRANSLSASVRSGKIGREDALCEMTKPPVVEEGLVEYMQKRMHFTAEEYEDIMSQPRKTYRDYKTYKKTFEKLRPFFWFMLKFNLIPESFYIKYCFPVKTEKMITIIDYGMGNLGSIVNMLKLVGVPSVIAASTEKIEAASKLILPGVGAFDAAMARIAQSGLREILEKRVLEDKIPVLGICLGMQLLTRGSEEGNLPGLGWIPADTKRIPARKDLKVPHMGWNIVRRATVSSLTEGFDTEETRFYFVHSYAVAVDSQENSILKSDYGIEFDSAIQKENIFGVQFHPEKSHRFGKKLFSNFINI